MRCRIAETLLRDPNPAADAAVAAVPSGSQLTADCETNQHHRSNRWYEEGPLKGPLGRIDDHLTLVFSSMEPLDFWIGHRRGSWSSLTPLTRSPESQELRPDQRPFPGRDVSVTRRHAGNGRASTVAPPEAVDLLLIKANSPLKAVLDAQIARVRGGAESIQGEGAVTPASRSGENGRTLAAG